MKKILFISILAIGLIATSCTTEEKTDIRDAAVGNYSGEMAFFAIQDNALVSLDNLLPDENTTATVSKDATNAAIIKITIDGDVFTGKVAEASNGFSFDIAEQTVSNTLITGYNFAILGTVKYHGLFSSADKELIFGVKIPVNSSFFDDDTKTLLVADNITDVVLGIGLKKK